jgi:hypothetical protein
MPHYFYFLFLKKKKKKKEKEKEKRRVALITPILPRGWLATPK